MRCMWLLAYYRRQVSVFESWLMLSQLDCCHLDKRVAAEYGLGLKRLARPPRERPEVRRWEPGSNKKFVM